MTTALFLTRAQESLIDRVVTKTLDLLLRERGREVEAQIGVIDIGTTKHQDRIFGGERTEASTIMEIDTKISTDGDDYRHSARKRSCDHAPHVACSMAIGKHQCSRESRARTSMKMPTVGRYGRRTSIFPAAVVRVVFS